MKRWAAKVRFNIAAMGCVRGSFNGIYVLGGTYVNKQHYLCKAYSFGADEGAVLS
tara:strand:- start:144 stop:308 length:165 start_codon:yes stop_codon:yes gene_type:complete